MPFPAAASGCTRDLGCGNPSCPRRRAAAQSRWCQLEVSGVAPRDPSVCGLNGPPMHASLGAADATQMLSAAGLRVDIQSENDPTCDDVAAVMRRKRLGLYPAAGMNCHITRVGRSGPHRRGRASLTLAFEGASGSAGRTESTFTSKRQTWTRRAHDRLAACADPSWRGRRGHVSAPRPSRS